MKIEHIALWAKDIEALKSFYERYFNARSSDKYVNPDRRFSSYFLSFDSGARLEIMHMESVTGAGVRPQEQFTGYTHLAFSVGSRDEVDSLTARLAKEGFEILDGPRTTGDGYYESAVLDPENNHVEITV